MAAGSSQPPNQLPGTAGVEACHICVAEARHVRPHSQTQCWAGGFERREFETTTGEQLAVQRSFGYPDLVEQAAVWRLVLASSHAALASSYAEQPLEIFAATA